MRHVSVLAFAACLALAACEPYPGSGSSSGGGGSSSGGSSGSSVASGRQPVAAGPLCNRLVNECKQSTTTEACVRSFAAVLITPACADGLARAGCAELTASSSSLLQTCFPRCNGTLASCNGDGTITICTTAGTTNVLDCAAACQADGNRTFTGTCGTASGADRSAAPQCWCL